MSPDPALAGVQRFALADIPPQPWRNGGGVTRTVGAAFIGPALRWRVSAADITQPGAFSVFDGVDRTAVLMAGPGLALQLPHERLVFEGPGALARFAGELPVHAQPGSTPARLWNVMVARGQLRAEVQVLRGDAARIDPCACAVLVVLAGALALAEGPVLQAEEGLLCHDLAAPLRLRAAAPGTCWVITRLLQA